MLKLSVLVRLLKPNSFSFGFAVGLVNSTALGRGMKMMYHNAASAAAPRTITMKRGGCESAGAAAELEIVGDLCGLAQHDRGRAVLLRRQVDRAAHGRLAEALSA